MSETAVCRRPAVRARGLTGWVFMSMLSAPVEAATSLSGGQLAELDRPALETAQGRLDYLGPSLGRLPPLLFVVEGRVPVEGLAGMHPELFTVSVDELQAFLREAGSSLTGPTKPEPWISFTLLIGEADHRQRFERGLSEEDAKPFFAAMWRAFRSRPASLHVQSWGCPLGLLPDGRPKDITGSTELAVSRFTPDAAGRYAGQITVRNISSTLFPSPVSVVFELSGNARVSDPDGTTCHVEPVGRGYLHLPLTSDQGLLPNEEAVVPVTLHNDEHEPLSMSLKVVTGPEPR
ncbi:MAG: hypothetical protein HYZ92_02530 [Candidatus Omnitrophica bacterium]|nr:hypothetical protein [Candidatus Omnitrophota bacterium]